MKQMAAKLNKYEVRFYFLTWIIGVLYSMYHVYLAGDYFYTYGDFNYFTDEWIWLGRKHDNYDYEWNIWIEFMKKLAPWIVVQLLISQILKHTKTPKTMIYSWYIIVTSTFLWNFCGFGGILYLLISPCIVCLLTSLQSKKLVYVVHITILVVFQYSSLFSEFMFSYINVDSTTDFLLTLAFFWLQLKGMDCSIDNINNYKHENLIGFFKNIIQCTAYCWYLPNLFFGPHILYHKFIRSVDEPGEKLTLHRIIIHLLNLLRFTFWIFFTKLMFHFVYSTALSHRPHVVEKLNAWAFYGMGYCMGQYFCNKYVVFYGIAGEISRMDGIDAPPPPKCIGRIHLYSDMWKYFDRGLYEFLVRCIYGPISEFNIPFRKFVASFITFVFIYVWHGVHKFVLIWTVLNFLGVMIVTIANSIGNSPLYIKWQQKFLSPRNTRRFNCILATPLLAVSAVSNFYFFGGEIIGNLYMYRLFHDSPISIFILMFILYCCCQVSTEMKLIEHRKGYNKNCDEFINKKLN
ncbi:hypothetical protein PV326_004255 [Microctonus aethiopoides]|nr:hypothetical protein PV326_004255 [Microctonus aethiopoides]